MRGDLQAGGSSSMVGGAPRKASAADNPFGTPCLNPSRVGNQGRAAVPSRPGAAMTCRLRPGESLCDGPTFARWKAAKNIRSLICHMESVMWKNAQWEPVKLSSLVTDEQVRAAYHKAI